MAINETRATAMTWLGIAGAVVVIALLIALVWPFLMGDRTAQDNQGLGVGGPEEDLITDPLTIMGATSTEDLEGRDVQLTDVQVLRTVNDNAFLIMTSQGEILVVYDDTFFGADDRPVLRNGQRVNISGEIAAVDDELDLEDFEGEEQLLEGRGVYIRAQEVSTVGQPNGLEESFKG